jgi:ribosomal protein S18 acetylase RimI-like enzyme
MIPAVQRYFFDLRTLPPEVPPEAATPSRGWLAKYVRDLRTFPGDVALAYRHGGFQELWDTLAHRTLHRLFRSDRLIVFAQPLDVAPDIAPPEGVMISPVTSADGCDALVSLVPQRDLVRFRSLVAAGRHCLIAWRGNQPIGYAWVAEQVGPDVTLVPVPLPPHAAYLWDLYVIPAERCNGIGSALASARCQVARARGFREGWRMIAPSNHASVRTLARSGPGARIVGEIRYIKLITRMHARFIPAAVPAELSA